MEDEDHDNQRSNEKVPAAEPHHNRGFGDALLRHGRQGAEFWRQGSPRRILLQWTEQALLLWRGIRVPDR